MPFTKCAVPCFFIISGYLLFDDYDIKQERLKRNLKHIGIIALWSTALFAFWKEFICIFIEGHIYIPSANSLLAWVVFNDSPFEYHLWYLFAYLYVLLIVALINKYNKWEILYCVVPILLIADLAFGSYSILLWGWEPPYIYVRNFLFVGLPYFAIGTYIKRRMKEGGAFSPFARYILVGGILLFTVTTI
jgi:surface polysaccharide O-acyltransferase-like enzyme